MTRPNDAQPRQDFAASLRRQQLIGLAVIALFAGTLTAWSMSTTLQGAVAATGQFVVASDVKKVQHPLGGVIGELLVRDGQKVVAGQPVLRLDETIAKANYQLISRQLDEFAVRTLRLEAERDGTDTLVVPPELEPRRSEPDIVKLIAAETRLFEARRSARDGQRAQLGKRIVQLNEEITGLKAQKAAKEREAEIIAVELIGVQDLYRRNLIQLPRLSALQRDQATNAGQRGQLVASIAQSEGRIAETELQIIQIGEDQRAEAMKELREIQAREGELIERRTAAFDQLKRIEIRAPAAGTVHQLAMHTVGGVLQPGEQAMLIVPDEDDLQLDARISPADIDQVTLGQTVRVRVHAGNQSTNPELIGTLSRLSADVSRDDRLGLVYYTARVDLPKSEIDRLKPIRIIAGMQADAFIETEPRTPLAFLMKPIDNALARTFRER